jgi:hypothetical protein
MLLMIITYLLRLVHTYREEDLFIPKQQVLLLNLASYLLTPKEVN